MAAMDGGGSFGISGDAMSGSEKISARGSGGVVAPRGKDDDSGHGMGIWLSMASCTVRFALPIMLLILGAAVPFAMQVPRVKLLHSFDLAAPSDAEGTQAYTDLLSEFGAGTVIQNGQQHRSDK